MSYKWSLKRQRVTLERGGQAFSPLRRQVHAHRRSSRNRVRENSSGFPKPIIVGEGPTFWPPAALLALDKGFSSSDDVTRFDHVTFEVDISSQLNSTSFACLGRDVVVSPKVGGGGIAWQ